MPTWTHRPTWPDEPEHRDTDRVVLRDGIEVGRVTHIPAGPEKGKWQWSTVWSGLDSGVVRTREDALERIRTAFEAKAESDPEGLSKMLRYREVGKR